MKLKGNVTGRINTKTGYIQVDLPLIKFEEDGCFVVYCPAIDVYGYGETEEEADESYKVSMSEFFNYTLNKGTLFDEMKRLGWNIPKSKRKKITPPTMVKLLKDNDNFSRIFNNHSYRKTDMTINLPVAV